MDHAIDVCDLHKSYGTVEAVRGVSFAVPPGAVFCLLGPNGAGKTTTTEILEGHRLPTRGRVRVLGHDPARGQRALRERVGVVLQSCGIQDDLTVGELLEMYGRYYRRPRPAAEVVELVELRASLATRAAALSGGQRRRLDLALALVGDPDLLFLDEPTTGFDPHARRQAWSTIRSLCSLGKTVFLTTHFMDEAQSLADQVAVMVAGRVVACGSPQTLGGRDALPTEIRFRLPDGVGLGSLPALPGAALSREGAAVLVTTGQGVLATQALTAWALERGVSLAGFTVAQPTLEDVYLALTGGVW
ncbi:MAG TPA: ABC transporter ATP-binding protein [Solirubrobacteraceae bacterium]|jgi:ABC-2 type transport system ATP-binding protein|nr:ABC transporter ATP-binding protein [Solirubrobacteraceae bacterium]